MAVSQDTIRAAIKKRFYTPPQVATRYGVKSDKVLTWIHNGELVAINVATETSTRPRFRISEEELAAFEARRSERPVAGVAPKRTRRTNGDVEEFF